VIELLIDILVACSSVGVLWWSWRDRGPLLDGSAPGLPGG
jgi:hypothetical protein